MSISDTIPNKVNVIIDEVAREYSTTADWIIKAKRYRSLTSARMQLYRRLKSELNMTIEQIAEACDRSPSSVKRVMYGQVQSRINRPDPRLRVIKFKTWLTRSDYSKLELLASRSGVNVSDITHGILVDVIFNECS